MWNQKKALHNGLEYRSALGKKSAKIRKDMEKELEKVDLEARIASEMPESFLFNSMFLYDGFAPTVRSQAKSLESALDCAKLFDLEQLFIVRNGCVSFCHKAKAEDPAARGTLTEISPIFAKVTGISFEDEETNICFFASLPTYLIQVKILLFDDRRISRSWNTRALKGRTIVENVRCSDETGTFSNQMCFAGGSDEHPNSFTLWNPL